MEEFKDYAYKQYQEDAEEYLRLCKVDDNDVEKMRKKGAVKMCETGNLMWCKHTAEKQDTTLTSALMGNAFQSLYDAGFSALGIVLRAGAGSP